MADKLATAGDLASLLQIPSIDTATANLLLEMATAVVQATTGQRIIQVQDDEIVLDLDEYDTDWYLYLPQRPVTAVSSVAIGSTVLVPVTDYTVQFGRGRLWRSCGWRSELIRFPDQPSTVAVTYTHGYPDGHQKLQLARSAVLSMINALYANPTGAASVRIDDYAATYAAMERQLASSQFLTLALKKQYTRSPRSPRLVDAG